jgi:nucleoside-diphosphate kinase
MTSQDMEPTLVLLKPDALKVSLTGYILSQLSEFHTGMRFAGAKIVHVSRLLASEHYAEHSEKPFFSALLDYLTGKSHYPDKPKRRRVIALVYRGPGAVGKVRAIAGPTNPHDAREKAPGTIRALGTVVLVKDESGRVVGDRLDNLVHASANATDAEREIKLWFKPNDISPYMRDYESEICDSHHYYYKDDRLYDRYEPGSTCVLSPGEVAWKSDLESLRQIAAGKPSPCSLRAVVAKYLINTVGES